MSQIKITLILDIPEGTSVSVPDVDYRDQAPPPTAAPPQVFSGETWQPTGECPKHKRPLRASLYEGKPAHCTAKDDQGNDRGYCVIEVGTIWNGKRVAA